MEVCVVKELVLADRFEERAKVVKAMAHPSRLMMIDELSRGERCVCDLRELVDADMSTVSKHLSVLKKVGIVEDERRGRRISTTGCACPALSTSSTASNP